jgi:3-oxoacyl-[acyl-carrier-protein] synthase II
MTGHTSGGSGLYSLAMAVQSLDDGAVPGLPGLGTLTGAATGLRFTGRTVTVQDPRVAQVNAFGFGGLNAVAMLERIR